MPDAQEAWPAAPAVRLFLEHVRAYLVGKLGMFITAPHQRRPLAAGVFFRLGDRALYKYGASNEKLQHLRGAKLVMGEAIKQLARNGVRTLNLCRTDLGNEGLRRFKLGLGDGDQKIEYDKYDLREGRFVTEIDATSGWCSRVFRVLPLRVIHLIGVAPYRHCA